MAATITLTSAASAPLVTETWTDREAIPATPIVTTLSTQLFSAAAFQPFTLVEYTQVINYVPQSGKAPTGQTAETSLTRSTTTTTTAGQISTTLVTGTGTYTGPLSDGYTTTIRIETPPDSNSPVVVVVETGGMFAARITSSTPTSTASSASVAATGAAESKTSNPKSNYVSPGATAGAAIGAAIAAALIAFLATMFFCRRKRRNDRGGIYMTEKPSSAHTWDAFLPQSADDGTIQRSVSSLYSQIDMHVENYYGSNAMASVSTESRVCLQKVDSGNLPSSAEELMRETTSPLPVIKHCFAWTILSRLSPTPAGEDSLLPPELARLPPKQHMSKSRSERESKAMTQAYPYWRILTAHLLYPHSRQNSPTSSLNAHGADDVVQTLMTAFQPWSKSVKGGASAAEHLRSVVKTATETGLLIMSQPSTFAFEWDGLDHAASAVVVLPAFEKTADERGQTLSQRYFLVNPKMENISK